MSVQLEIDDGNPYYLSPDIWVVPGSNPAGPQGIPRAGQASYVWARVHNTGTDSVTGAAVNYYWANPATLITQNTANSIGTSFVDLDAGQTAEVLCLTPWLPSWVNGGHECLIAEVVSAADPPPPRTPDDPFNPPAERQMAQLNLTLINAMQGLVVFPFLVGNAPILRSREITVEVKRAPVEQLRAQLETLQLKRLPEEMSETKEFGLQPYNCGDQVSEVGKQQLSLSLNAGDQYGLALAVRVPEKQPGHAALYLIEQREQQRIIGGIGVLVRVPAASS
jgi:hypothetical protein